MGVTRPVDLSALTIADARRAIDAGQLSAVELTSAVLDQIARLNPRLNAYLHVDADTALEQARAADRQRDRQPLRGIPLCIKDIIDVRGMPTTAGSAAWLREPTRDAGVTALLRGAGAVIVGKGHTNEFAYGADGLNPHRGDCVNPYDPSHISGGSSSGPAVATAAGLALGGIGTDTSGSVRIPASLCGLVGVRPTVGLVPSSGVLPLAWSYDSVGPLARSAEDAAILLGVMAGRQGDRTLLSDLPETGLRSAGDLRGVRLGVVEELVDEAEPYVSDGIAAAMDHLGSLGAQIVPVRIDMLRHATAMHLIVQHAEAAQVHAPWFDMQREHYADQVRTRLEVGRLIPASTYIAAQQARRLLVEDVARALNGVDALLAPSTPIAAPLRSTTAVKIHDHELTLRAALLRSTLPFSQIGSAAVSVPVGSYEGLPYGMQIIGRPFAEALVLRVAAACEERWPWHQRKPDLASDDDG